MVVISFVNPKGGSGKTTSAVNIAVALMEKKKRVLLIDLDPHSHATHHLFSPQFLKGKYHIGNVIIGPPIFSERPLKEVIIKREIWMYKGGRRIKRLGSIDVVPSSLELSYAEWKGLEISLRVTELGYILDAIKQDYDYILCDCPPNLGFFTRSALLASDLIIIPMKARPMDLDGAYLLIKKVIPNAKRLNPRLQVKGAILIEYDGRRILDREIFQHTKKLCRVFDSKVPHDIKLALMPIEHKHILEAGGLMNRLRRAIRRERKEELREMEDRMKERIDSLTGKIDEVLEAVREGKKKGEGEVDPYIKYLEKRHEDYKEIIRQQREDQKEERKEFREEIKAMREEMKELIKEHKKELKEAREEGERAKTGRTAYDLGYEVIEIGKELVRGKPVERIIRITTGAPARKKRKLEETEEAVPAVEELLPSELI